MLSSPFCHLVPTHLAHHIPILQPRIWRHRDGKSVTQAIQEVRVRAGNGAQSSSPQELGWLQDNEAARRERGNSLQWEEGPSL